MVRQISSGASSARNQPGSVHDDSVDRSSIGQGSFDALAGRNKLYEMDDEAVREHLSLFLESSYAFDGLEYADATSDC